MSKKIKPTVNVVFKPNRLSHENIIKAYEILLSISKPKLAITKHRGQK